MKTVTTRLTDEEHAFLTAHALTLNAHIGTLIRDAAMTLAQQAGASPRSEGSVTCMLELWPMDVSALAKYRDAHMDGFPSRAHAARAAMRVGLMQRGHLTLPEGSEPD
jgi:hypothetical protein